MRVVGNKDIQFETLYPDKKSMEFHAKQILRMQEFAKTMGFGGSTGLRKGVIRFKTPELADTHRNTGTMEVVMHNYNKNKKHV